MIGLDSDSDPKAGQAAIANNSINWGQASLVDGFQSSVADAYRVSAIPSIWLIDPQGKVAAKALVPEGLDRIVGQALAK